MHLVVGPSPISDGAPADSWQAVAVDRGAPGPVRTFPRSDWPRFAEAVLASAERPETLRWVWADTEELVPELLRHGIEIARCHDLALCQRILAGVASDPRNGVDYRPLVPLVPPGSRDEEPAGRMPPVRDPLQDSLFEAPGQGAPSAGPTGPELLEEFLAQERAVAGAPDGHRLNLLLAAESQGALVAAEMHHHGLPWNRAIHERLLEEQLGPRPAEGERPALMERLARRLAEVLEVPRLNPDSPQDLLRAMQSAGMSVESTRKWELRSWAEQSGPRAEARRAMIAPILEYKKLYRLWTANGWHWLDDWVREDRFRARYLVGGVVTGRWAAHGGGAMQIPQGVRDAVRADPGWVLTVADASQVEPRILAAMSGDRALAVAGRGQDLYLGIAEIGRRAGSALDDRQAAKYALLGAMYGATSGEAGALVPHLKRLFPQAIDLVERAAAEGERGGQVRTWLGRTSPLPDDAWFAAVRDVGSAQAEARSRRMSRSHGRFTRNFVVQGTAAEWALCWMGEIRRRLRSAGAEAGGPPGPGMRTRLVFFVHDEVVLHGPQEEAEAVRRIVEESASAAGRLLFGEAPVEFPLTVAQVESYAEAK